MPRHGLNNSPTATDHLNGGLTLDAGVDRAPDASWQMMHIALAILIAVLFISTLALKPATMAGFPTLGNLNADACGDLLDDGPTPPDVPVLPPSVEQPQWVLTGTSVAAFDRQPIVRPRRVSFPALPQAPPAQA